MKANTAKVSLAYQYPQQWKKNLGSIASIIK